MGVKTFPLLVPVGIKKGRINVKKHKLRFFDGIEGLTQLLGDPAQLPPGNPGPSG